VDNSATIQYNLGIAAEYKSEGTPGIADMERLVAGIEGEDRLV